jgi:ERI1 exoribonuclease 3
MCFNSSFQETVDLADEFPLVWSQFQAWLKSLGALEKPTDYAFLTCGDWDLKTMLPEQLAYTATIHPEFDPTIPPPMDCWINIKKSFIGHYKVRKSGMGSILHYLKLGLEGRHHSGIDDCKNISRIVKKMRDEKWKPVDDLP